MKTRAMHEIVNIEEHMNINVKDAIAYYRYQIIFIIKYNNRYRIFITPNDFMNE